MHTLTRSILAFVVSPIGILVLGVLDSTIFNWFPLGIDSAVVLLSARLLAGIHRRVRRTSALMLAVLDLIPPPFPFTLFVLAAGALGVRAPTFFITLIVCRAVRFGAEAFLAMTYGPSILRWVDSDIVHDVGGVCIALAIAGSVVSIVRLVRSAGLTTRRAAA